MKKVILCCTLFFIHVACARGGVMIGTTNPSGSPLAMAADSTSGPMSVTAVSDNNDVMAAWQFSLMILPGAGAAGTLMFNSPGPGPASAPNPSNYIFDSHGVGISILGGGMGFNHLDFANDNDLNLGTPMPTGQVFNLLQVNFAASPNASGLFGIYAVVAPAPFNTVWTDGSFNTQDFSNAPSSGGNVLIGDVMVSAVPEPSTLTLLGLGCAILTGWSGRRRARAEWPPDLPSREEDVANGFSGCDLGGGSCRDSLLMEASGRIVKAMTSGNW